jgi:AAA ATPase domain
VPYLDRCVMGVVASGKPESIFCGRESEIEALMVSLAAARVGRGSLLAISGEAGIGKTRLVEELVRRAEAPAGRVLWGRCLEPAGAPSYWPWIRVLRAHAAKRGLDALRDDLGADAALLAPLLPGLATSPGLARAGNDPEARYHLFSAILSWLRRLAADDLLLIVLEDVHWADEASLALLEFIAPEIGDTHLLLTFTLRERQRPRLPRPLVEAVRRSHRVSLRGLDREAVAAIVSDTSGTEVASGVVEQLVRVTEGNPFFLGEVLRALDQEGRLSTELTPGARLALPDTVRDSVRRHLDPLSEEDRDILALAAVGGGDVDVPLLQEASGLTAAAVLERISDPIARGLLTEVSSGRFRFVHALLRETIYGDLLPAARVQLHARVGEALERLQAGESTALFGALASHFLHASPLGTAAKAAAYAQRAAAEAKAVYAYHDALGAYEQALAAVGTEAVDRPRRLHLRLEAGDAARRAGLDARAREFFRLAAQDARALSDSLALFLAATGYYQVSPRFDGSDPETLPLLREALAGAGEGDGAIQAILLAILGATRYCVEGLEEGAAMSASAVEMARRVGDPGTLATALLTRQLVDIGPGSSRLRLALADEALGLIEGKEQSLAHAARAARFHALVELGELRAAEAELDRMARTAERLGEPVRRWQVKVYAAMIALLEGRFDDSTRLAAEALAVRRSGSDPMAFEVFVLQMFIARRDTSDPGGLEGSLKWMIANHPNTPIWPCVLGVLYADQGRLDEAREVYEGIVADDFARLRVHQNYPVTLAWTSRICTLVGDTSRAPAIYERLLPFADQNLVLGPSSQASIGSTHRYLGLLSMTLGDLERAAHHFPAAIEMNERMGARAVLACCQHEYARVLEQRNEPGDRTLGRELLQAARASAKLCGLSQLLGWIKFLGPIEPEAAAVTGPSLRAPLQAPQEAPPTAIAETDDAVANALRPLSDAPRSGPVSPSGSETRATFRLEGGVWVIGFSGEIAHMKDAKGAHLLATLLRYPGQEIHVLDLDAGTVGAAGGGDRGDAGPLIDSAARAAYRSRLEDLREELEEAQQFNDPVRAEKAQQEIDLLAEELARGVGLSGRERRAAPVTERARVNATRTIGKVLKRISELSPRLGEHLRATVRTGYVCVYAPDPASAIRWQL